jgi:hypothetical protein
MGRVYLCIFISTPACTSHIAFKITMPKNSGIAVPFLKNAKMIIWENLREFLKRMQDAG